MRTNEIHLTGNSALFRKLHKINICRLDGRCTVCPWHRVENDFGRKDRRSWKTYRKTRYRHA